MVKIIDAYDEDTAVELYVWIQRHFLDHDQQVHWFHWVRLLIRIRNRRQLRVPFPLKNEVLERIRALVESPAVSAAREHWERQVPALLAEPATDFEMRALTFEDGSPKYMKATLMLILEAEQAREIWQHITETLTATEQEALLEWGTKELTAG